MDGHSLTVFKFTPSDTSRVATRSIISLPSPFGFSPALPSTDTVQARNLIASTVGTDGWKSLSVPVPEIVTFDLSNCYVYKKAPPSRNSLGANQASGKDSRSIKDWGSPPAADELLDINALEEFVSTDLRDIFLASPSRESVPTLDRKGKRKAVAALESHPSTVTSDASAKRVKLDFVLEPKQYHYYPYPIVRKSLDVKSLQERVPAFKKSTPTFLHPHTENDVKKYLEEPFSTSAWLVPIRGRMPWSGASEGKMVGEGEMKEGTEPIVWTPTGLKNFWKFLIDIHGWQNFGPVSLSLHIATGSSEACADNYGGVLDQDHIKIRHDASIALTIRTMLDVWKYAVDGDGAINQAQPRKVRPLRGARLVLVNDRSEGLMVL